MFWKKKITKAMKLRNAVTGVLSIINDIEEGIEELKTENRAIDQRVEDLRLEKALKLNEGLEAQALVDNLKKLTGK